MSAAAFFGAIELGFLFGIVALGVYISFRILDFPDLTVDGSLPLGAAVAATLIVNGFNPFVATIVAMLAGAVAGLITALLNVKLKILHLLASILTMTALYSVNLRVMGKPNVSLLGENTVFSAFEWIGLPYQYMTPVLFMVVALVVLVILNFFLNSEIGLSLRATGANTRMARAQGVHTSVCVCMGMAISNALVSLAGALFAQSQGSADVSMGIGVIVTGLAAVIIGEAVFPSRRILFAALACIVGSVLYQLAVGFAMNASFIGLQAQDLKLITAILVVIAMTLPTLRGKIASRRSQ